MVEFFKNLVSKESAFRAVIGAIGTAATSNPELLGGAPGWVGPALIFMALAVKAGDKNPE